MLQKKRRYQDAGNASTSAKTASMRAKIAATLSAVSGSVRKRTISRARSTPHGERPSPTQAINGAAWTANANDSAQRR